MGYSPRGRKVRRDCGAPAALLNTAHEARGRGLSRSVPLSPQRHRGWAAFSPALRSYAPLTQGASVQTPGAPTTGTGREGQRGPGSAPGGQAAWGHASLWPLLGPLCVHSGAQPGGCEAQRSRLRSQAQTLPSASSGGTERQSLWACRGERCGEQERAEGALPPLVESRRASKEMRDRGPEVDNWAERPVRAEGQRGCKPAWLPRRGASECSRGWAESEGRFPSSCVRAGASGEPGWHTIGKRPLGEALKAWTWGPGRG